MTVARLFPDVGFDDIPEGTGGAGPARGCHEAARSAYAWFWALANEIQRG